MTATNMVSGRTPARWLVGTLVGLAGWLVGAEPAGAKELIGNGSFEMNQGAGTLPAGWLAQGTTPGLQVEVDDTTSAVGAYSLRVSGRAAGFDGPRHSLKATLSAAGSGKTFGFRFRIKVDDVVSVRALLKYSDGNGPRVDLILAERVVRTPGEWTLIEGSVPVYWSGALSAAALVFEVTQQSRQTGVLPGRLVPAYNLDDVSMDDDADGDGLFDRDEPALGFDPGRRDTDGDGLPDRWERDHGFVATADESAADVDGDGASNLDEYWAATDPRAAGSYPGQPANPKTNATARAVLRWLSLLPGRAPGRHLAVGQMVSELGTPTEYGDMIDRLGATTGRFPAILSMAIEPPYDGPGQPLQIAEAEPRALAYWKAGGLVMLKWAIYNPWVVLNASTQTGVDMGGLLDPAGSPPATRAANQAAHDNLMAWMATVADAFERLRAEGVVIMFRPISEMNGGWFWWGGRERSEYVALWRFIYQYFAVERELDNLIWVYESDSATHAPSVVGGPSFASDYHYPGDDVVDVMSHNFYSATWALPFDANEIYRRYPKVYGIPQAGPDKASRDGSFDNLTYVVQTEARLPRSSFFIVWNSFPGTDPMTMMPALRRVGIVDNRNASALMNHASIITRESVPDWSVGPDGGDGSDGGVTRDGGTDAAVDGTGDGGPAGSSGDGGCGCGLGGSGSPGGPTLALVAAFVLVGRLSRQRASRGDRRARHASCVRRAHRIRGDQREPFAIPVAGVRLTARVGRLRSAAHRRC